MEGTLKEWALRYASMGLAVFPLRPKDKRPATKNGCKSATTNKSQIEAWWNRYPDCNIGIATGKRSGGLLAIDLDIDEDKDLNGYESLKEWQSEHGELPDTWQSITGRGGYHIFYKSHTEIQNKVSLYPGVDIRGEGGYIVAPPSLHPNGRAYEWEQEPGEFALATANDRVDDFLHGPLPREDSKQGFKEPQMIPEGERVSTLVRLIGSLKAKGLNDKAIRAAVQEENEAKCIPLLTEKELEKEVFPALKRDWKADKSYISRPQNTPEKAIWLPGKVPVINVGSIIEKEPEWLIDGYFPRRQISIIAGDGGVGKTSVICNVISGVSAGKKTIFEHDMPEDFCIEPQKVLFLSSEDSFEYTLVRRLRKNGANMNNIITVPISNPAFQEIKFNSEILYGLIKDNRPALAVFDPLQSYVPPEIQMGHRNAMRDCLNPLIGLGEEFNMTTIIIMHTNKQTGMWGRKRMADSADVWDIARSVLLVGETNEKEIRYISQEKSNNSTLRKTILFSINDEVVEFKGETDKKDRDYVLSTDYDTRQKPQREEAKKFILDFLKDGEKEVSELDDTAAAMSISKNTLGRAKTDLKNEGKIKTWSIGFNPKKYYISLIPSC